LFIDEEIFEQITDKNDEDDCAKLNNELSSNSGRKDEDGVKLNNGGKKTVFGILL
jgi:hypothetical protein